MGHMELCAVERLSDSLPIPAISLSLCTIRRRELQFLAHWTSPWVSFLACFTALLGQMDVVTQWEGDSCRAQWAKETTGFRHNIQPFLLVVADCLGQILSLLAWDIFVSLFIAGLSRPASILVLTMH